MRAGRTIIRRLTAGLALVLTVVFALSTFHVHGQAGSTPDAGLAAFVAVDGGGHGAGSSPDDIDRHVAVDCPVCALLTHILVPPSIQPCMGPIAGRERFMLKRASQPTPPLFEHDRPPIARAV